MIRGDTKQLKFKIKNGDDYIDGSIYSEVELQINQQHLQGSIKKLLSKGEVVWDNDHFVTFLSQEDTFKLNDGNVRIQVRLLVGDDCKATLIKSMSVGEVLSDEVLE